MCPQEEGTAFEVAFDGFLIAVDFDFDQLLLLSVVCAIRLVNIPLYLHADACYPAQGFLSREHRTQVPSNPLILRRRISAMYYGV